MGHLNKSKVLAAILASVGAMGVVGLSVPARAGLNFTNQGTSALGSWAAISGDSIVYTSLATPGTATTSQGNVTAATGATATAEVETFTPATSYTLAAIGVSAPSRKDCPSRSARPSKDLARGARWGARVES